jgi:uncharacterized membrane protein YgcG
MKRFIFTSLTLLAMSSLSPAHAQKSRQYDDDIYGGKASSQTYSEDEPGQRSGERYRENERTYPSSETSSGNTYNEQDNAQYRDEYYNSDDDYYYSSNINRFYHPFYDRPYWSSFYNPYWYDPYWVDPYWGWSPWTRPGISISFGYGPYWSSYWGWSSWYGCPYFGSYWGYPAYGYGGYYSGYWNGYYSGLYNGYGDAGYHYRPTVTYGPRYTLRPASVRNTNGITTGGYNGFRMAPANNTTDRSGIRGEGVRPTANQEVAPIRENRNLNANTRSNAATEIAPRNDERPVRNGWREESIKTNEDARTSREPAQTNQRQPSDRNPRTESAPPTRSYEAPRVQEQRSFSQPRNEAPARSFDRGGGGGFGGGRSFGGGGGGGGRSGGGGFGGGGHRR